MWGEPAGFADEVDGVERVRMCTRGGVERKQLCAHAFLVATPFFCLLVVVLRGDPAVETVEIRLVEAVLEAGNLGFQSLKRDVAALESVQTALF